MNEKWLGLCREFGPDNVGLSTGDASVNRDAPILCCTAENFIAPAMAEMRFLKRHIPAHDGFEFFLIGDEARHGVGVFAFLAQEEFQLIEAGFLRGRHRLLALLGHREGLLRLGAGDVDGLDERRHGFLAELAVDAAHFEQGLDGLGHLHRHLHDIIILDDALAGDVLLRGHFLAPGGGGAQNLQHQRGAGFPW